MAETHQQKNIMRTEVRSSLTKNSLRKALKGVAGTLKWNEGRGGQAWTSLWVLLGIWRAPGGTPKPGVSAVSQPRRPPKAFSETERSSLTNFWILRVGGCLFYFPWA